MYGKQMGFFDEERQLKFLWCVSDEKFAEQNIDRDCDECEDGSLTESVNARIEEENALKPKFDNKKFDKAVVFLLSSIEIWTRYKERSRGSIYCWKYFTQVCHNHP